MYKRQGLVQSTLSTKVEVISLNEKIFSEISLSFFVQIFGAYGLCRAQGRTGRLVELMDAALQEQRAALAAGDYAAFVDKACLLYTSVKVTPLKSFIISFVFVSSSSPFIALLTLEAER